MMESREETWIDITHIGSVYEIQWNPHTDKHRHRPMSLDTNGQPDRRWVDRDWTDGLPPPREKQVSNDNIDERLESAMLTLERTILDVSTTVSEFRRSMVKLKRATQFLFWVFVIVGLCVLFLSWSSVT